jgi:hypothetical protein
MGKKGDGGAGAARAQAQANLEKAIKDIEALQIPDIEKQKLQLQLMSDAGFLEAEQLGREEEISVDPRLRQAQMDALSQLRERGQTGLTEEDKAVQDIMLRDVSAQEQAGQKAIMQGMAERGALDSGAQLAAQLGSQQSSYTRAANQASQNAIAAAEARRQALSQAGNMAQGMEATQFGQGQSERSYRQAIDQFNLQNRQDIAAKNLGIRQQDVGLRNQEQMYNKGLLQQQFENEKSIAAMKANARIGQATQQQQQADALARANAMKPGLFQSAATGAAAGAGFGAPGAAIGAGIGAISSLFKDGGVACEDGGMAQKYYSDGSGDIVPGDSYSGDRIDAKLNSKEMVLNVPQQQRLMDVIRGKEDLTSLGDEDIIEGVPESYRNKLHGKDKKSTTAKGFKKLLEILGE